MKAAIHKDCGQVAFYLDNSVDITDTMDSRNAYDLEGNHPKYGSPMKCYSCGAEKDLKITIDWEDTSYAIQRGRNQEEEPDKAGLALVPSAQEG